MWKFKIIFIQLENNIIKIKEIIIINYFNSLLGNEHALIKLQIEEDYFWIWLRQSWYASGGDMQIFNCFIAFRCFEESLVVFV